MVVTGDAMHAQQSLNTHIVEAGGDYLSTLEENQTTLYSDIALLFKPKIVGPGWNTLPSDFRTARNVDNLPTSVTGTDGVTETYQYKADDQRVARTRSGGTTIYVGGVYEEAGATKRSYYTFNGSVVAEREGSTLTYLFGDHLGSVALSIDASTGATATQDFTPWGEVRTGGVSATTLNYTGQQRDGTGLLYYNARYYDPALSRFVSADSVVPGAADGSMDGVAVTPLTVDFHEHGFRAGLAQENLQGFWFQMSDQQRQRTNAPWGPQQAQALNRYTYVQNNPLKYTDPTGHAVKEGNEDASYEQVCSKRGQQVSCSTPGSQVIYDSKGNALWKTCVRRQGCEVVWGGSDIFGIFQRAVDAMMSAISNSLVALAGSYVATAGLYTCAFTAGIGCGVAVFGWAVSAGITMYYMDQAQKELKKAKAQLREIRAWKTPYRQRY